MVQLSKHCLLLALSSPFIHFLVIDKEKSALPRKCRVGSGSNCLYPLVDYKCFYNVFLPLMVLNL